MEELSKTKQAIKLMEDTGCSQYAAAKKIGVSPSAVSAERKRIISRESRRCAWCGSVQRKSKGEAHE